MKNYTASYNSYTDKLTVVLGKKEDSVFVEILLKNINTNKTLTKEEKLLNALKFLINKLK